MRLHTIKDLESSDLLQGAKVFLRLDLNVPIHEGVISDMTRIEAAIPTIKRLLEHNCKIVLTSHLGRPKGCYDAKYSLEPVGSKIAELLNLEVVLAPINEQNPAYILERLQTKQILLLENLRFHPGEETNDIEFAKYLCDGMQIYINDAFGTCHRAHASTVGVPQIMGEGKCAAGLLVEKEVQALSSLLQSPKPPFALIIGGAKVSDKIGVILNLMEHCNRILIGGAMSYTFLKYHQINIGDSRIEADKMDLIEKIYQNAKARKVDIYLPVDHIYANDFNENANPIISKGNSIPDGFMGLDIGPETIKQYRTLIQSSETVFWNGPMGVFEWEKFSKGTVAIANAIADSGAVSVAGGGDSVAAINQCRLAHKFNHISTGGGASLEFLEGQILPGIHILKYKN